MEERTEFWSPMDEDKRVGKGLAIPIGHGVVFNWFPAKSDITQAMQDLVSQIRLFLPGTQKELVMGLSQGMMQAMYEITKYALTPEDPEEYQTTVQVGEA